MLPPVFLYQYHAYNQASPSNFCLTQRYRPVSERGCAVDSAKNMLAGTPTTHVNFIATAI
jgi:hypothetical protein